MLKNERFVDKRNRQQGEFNSIVVRMNEKSFCWISKKHFAVKHVYEAYGQLASEIYFEGVLPDYSIVLLLEAEA